MEAKPFNKFRSMLKIVPGLGPLDTDDGDQTNQSTCSTIESPVKLEQRLSDASEESSEYIDLKEGATNWLPSPVWRSSDFEFAETPTIKFLPKTKPNRPLR